MDSYFQYYRTATGKFFIGRAGDVNVLCNLLMQGENVVIYEPPKTGKNSLIHQAFFRMRSSMKRFLIAEVSLMNARTFSDVLIAMGDSMLRCVSDNPSTLRSLVEEHLHDSHLEFDADGYERHEKVLRTSGEVDDDDIRLILSLPWRLASEDESMYVVLNEFQNVMLTEDGERFCFVFENLLKETPHDARRCAPYLLVGSQVNMMKYIFEYKRFFFRQVERVKLSDIDTRDIIDYVLKGYLANGKVIQRELILGSCELFKNNIYYILHLHAISDSLTRGYLNESILMDALDALIAVNEPRFLSAMYDLTSYQVQLLKAIVDGHAKFSSAAIIRQYGLNSSANVKRLKDALARKELVTFDENDEPHILDPLFEYWVRTFYFKYRKV